MDRIALQTEVILFAYFDNETNQPIITQITVNPAGEMPSNELEVSTSNGTLFNGPNFLVLTIKI